LRARSALSCLLIDQYLPAFVYFIYPATYLWNF